jgi:non-ribosomal peptide synthetase component F
VIGILAIEMVGGVYCPLSPRDPQDRLQSLLEQTQSRFVLVHHLTKTMFKMNVLSVDIGSILTSNDIEKDSDTDLLATVLVVLDDIAYIIFTSGSTGIPKAVSNETNTIY